MQREAKAREKGAKGPAKDQTGKRKAQARKSDIPGEKKGIPRRPKECKVCRIRMESRESDSPQKGPRKISKRRNDMARRFSRGPRQN